jgi:flagellar biosynthetic protein FliP
MGPESTDFIGFLETASQSSVVEGMAPPIRIALMLGALALISTLLVSVTAFTRIVIVLSFVKRSLTTQEIPPNTVVLGLAFFLTAFVMGPTLDLLQRDALAPYFAGEKKGTEAWQVATLVLHDFMLRQTRTTDLAIMIDMAGIAAPSGPESTPLRVLVPAFMISELKTAFIMGFCIYLPFLLIDLVVSAVLMSLGMMMMPPMMVSLPFKILLFVLVDGWQLTARTLSLSFG